MPEQAGPSSPAVPFAVNERYLHAKTRHALTIRYVGLLPGTADSQIWIGVEYDDPSCGKGHSGMYKGIQVFHTVQPGAGAFIKFAGTSTPLVPGVALVDALEERYGHLDNSIAQQHALQAHESVVLGSSNAAIVVEAPNMDSVRQRISRLERLREIGFDGERVARLGGTEAQRLVFKERLKRVRALDLSKNLIESWDQVAEIANHLPGLTTLVLNYSRIQLLPPDTQTERYRTAFQNIEELHLGNSLYTWVQVAAICRVFPNLHVLDLNRNTLINVLGDSYGCLTALTSLNLNGCPLKNWESMATALKELPSLESLSLAETAIKAIPECRGLSLPGLKSLSLTDTLIARWRDIDHLAGFTGGKLENLRISCVGDRDDEHATLNPQFMTGNARTDRPFLIAKLKALTMLNGTNITSAERWDAELYYLHFINNLSLAHPAATWGRFEELGKLHGPSEKEAPKQTTLKSRLINLHVIPPNGLTFTVRVLPSAPVTLLDKKVAKQLKSPSAKVWTARKHDSILAAWEPVEELESGREVGAYVSDGDYVVVVV